MEKEKKQKCVAFIRSNSWMMPGLDHGTHNGYVAIPPGHKFYGMHYDEINKEVRVHGGLTFSEYATYKDKSTGSGLEINEKWIGKRNKVLSGAEFITENTEIGDDWFIVGFDTMHYGDDKYNWNKRGVIIETTSLLNQIEGLWVVLN